MLSLARHGNTSRENCQLKTCEAQLWRSTKLTGVEKSLRSAKMKSFPKSFGFFWHVPHTGKFWEGEGIVWKTWMAVGQSLHSTGFPWTLASQQRRKALRALICFYLEETLPVDWKLATASHLFPQRGHSWKLDPESGRILIGPAKQGGFPVNLVDLNTEGLLENYRQTAA